MACEAMVRKSEHLRGFEWLTGWGSRRNKYVESLMGVLSQLVTARLLNHQYQTFSRDQIP